MKSINIILFLLTFIALQGMASEPTDLKPSLLDKTEYFILNDTTKPPPAKLHGSLFAAMPGFFSYNFSQESIFYTPSLMTGFNLTYKKLLFQASTFVGKTDSYGLSFDLIYSFRSRKMDKEWVSSTGVLGEFAYFPSFQGNPDMSAYTVGICHALIRPYKWGGTAVGFLLGGAYVEGDICVVARMMINISKPVF